MTYRDRLADRVYRHLEAVAETLHRSGVTANQLTAVSLAAVAAVALAFTVGGTTAYATGAAVLVFAGLFDLLDGELARLSGTADARGDLLDHSFDRFADAVLLVGVTAATGNWLLGFFSVSAVLLTAYMGTQAQAVGVGRVYRGVLTRADVFAIVVAAAALEALEVSAGSVEMSPFEAALALTAVAGVASTLQRGAHVWRELEER